MAKFKEFKGYCARPHRRDYSKVAEMGRKVFEGIGIFELKLDFLQKFNFESIFINLFICVPHSLFHILVSSNRIPTSCGRQLTFWVIIRCTSQFKNIKTHSYNFLFCSFVQINLKFCFTLAVTVL